MAHQDSGKHCQAFEEYSQHILQLIGMGPPILVFGIVKFPSFLVRVTYLVPEGWWMAVTVAPSSGDPLSDFTNPVILLVVTWACIKKGAINVAKNKGKSLFGFIVVLFLGGKESK